IDMSRKKLRALDFRLWLKPKAQGSKPIPNGVYHLRTLYRNQGYGMCGRLSGGLHSPPEGRSGIHDSRNALYSPGRMHRLRRVCAGVPGRGDLFARRNPTRVVGLHKTELGFLWDLLITGSKTTSSPRASTAF